MILSKYKLDNIPSCIIFFIIFLIGISLYANSLKNGFVWDDETLIQKNHFLQNNHIIDFFSGPMHKEFLMYYRPLQMISFKFDFFIWGLEPFGYHLTNILLHIFNAMLAFVLAGMLLQNRLTSLLCAILFLIHPALSECVNFISSRSYLIVLFFFLLSIIFYIKNGESKNRTFFIISISSFVLSLFSHELAILFPAFLIFYELINNKKFKNAKLYFFILLAFVVLRFYIVPLESYKDKISNSIFFLTLPKIIFNYFKIIFLPINLHKLWQINTIKTVWGFEFLVYFLFIVGIMAMCRYLYKISRPLLTGMIWFMLMTFSWLHAVTPLYKFPVISEGWLYVPAIGIILIVSEFLSKCISSFNKIVKICAISLTCLIFITCILLTIKQNKIWNTNIAILSNIAKHDNKQPYILFGLGKAYLGADDYTNALLAFNNALGEFKKFDTGKIKYYLTETYNYMATIFLKSNRYKEATAILESAIKIDPLNSKSRYKLAVAYLMQENIVQAKGECKRAIEIENNARYTVLLKIINSIENHIKSKERFTVTLKIIFE